VRVGLTEKGISNLWNPRHFLKVENIPVLPSGKVDWQKVRTIISAYFSNS
jgi:non-ribosomal peptide synthetase component E (peptide arylation enzyme)